MTIPMNATIEKPMSREEVDLMYPNLRRKPKSTARKQVRSTWLIDVHSHEIKAALFEEGLVGTDVSHLFGSKLNRNRIPFFDAVRVWKMTGLEIEQFCKEPKQFYWRLELWEYMQNLYDDILKGLITIDSFCNIIGDQLHHLAYPLDLRSSQARAFREELTDALARMTHAMRKSSSVS